MMRQNLSKSIRINSKYFLFILFFIYSIKVEPFNQEKKFYAQPSIFLNHFEGIINKKKFEAVNYDSSNFHQAVFDSCIFSDVSLNSSLIDSSYFKFGKITNREFIQNLKLRNSIFEDVEISDFSFLNCNIENIDFVNCQINDIEFNSSTMSNIFFRNCKINNLKIFNSKSSKITVMGELSKNIIVEYSYVNFLEITSLTFGDISIKGGEISNLKLNKLSGSNGKILIRETNLNSYPYISYSVFQFLDMTKALINYDEFIIAQELSGDKSGTEKTRSDNYREARDIYALLSNHYLEVGMLKHQRAMEYRMKVVERKAMESGILKSWDYLWNDQFRGNYGLNPIVVIFSGIWCWLFFSFIYLLMGVIHFGWGMELTINALGEKYPGIEPKTISYKHRSSIFSYYLTCLAFSFDQLVSLGVNAFKISSFNRNFREIPKIYIPIGIGKFISIVQNIIGLVLFFNFIQAFLRSL